MYSTEEIAQKLFSRFLAFQCVPALSKPFCLDYMRRHAIYRVQIDKARIPKKR